MPVSLFVAWSFRAVYFFTMFRRFLVRMQLHTTGSNCTPWSNNALDIEQRWSGSGGHRTNVCVMRQNGVGSTLHLHGGGELGSVYLVELDARVVAY